MIISWPFLLVAVPFTDFFLQMRWHWRVRARRTYIYFCRFLKCVVGSGLLAKEIKCKGTVIFKWGGFSGSESGKELRRRQSRGGSDNIFFLMISNAGAACHILAVPQSNGNNLSGYTIFYYTSRAWLLVCLCYYYYYFLHKYKNHDEHSQIIVVFKKQ